MLALFGSSPTVAKLAQLASAQGHRVCIVEPDEALRERVMLRVGAGLTQRVDQGLMGAEACLQATARVRTATQEELRAVEFAVFAGAENDSDIGDALAAVEKELPLRVPLGVTLEAGRCLRELCGPLRYPQRTVGLRLPFGLVECGVVEVARELRTQPIALKSWHDFLLKLGLQPVHCTSAPGLVANRLQWAWLSEAWRFLEAEAIDPGTLDFLMCEAGGFNVGPCEWQDVIGHDQLLTEHQSYFQRRHGDLRFEPRRAQISMVAANRLGRKSGFGFFEYGLTATRPTATIESPGQKINSVQIMGSLGPARSLIDRVAKADIMIEHVAQNGGASCIVAGPARLVLSDGRSATQVAHDDAYPNVVVYDLTHNFLQAKRLAVARASQCSDVAYSHAVGFLQQCGFEVSRVGDIPGLPVSSSICALINEAADCVFENVCSAKDCDIVMQSAFGHPLGPLRWCDELGIGYVIRLIENMAFTYGSARHHVSPLLRHKQWAGKKFYDAAHTA